MNKTEAREHAQGYIAYLDKDMPFATPEEAWLLGFSRGARYASQETANAYDTAQVAAGTHIEPETHVKLDFEDIVGAMEDLLAERRRAELMERWRPIRQAVIDYEDRMLREAA